jgi:hypothetical protein
MKKSFWFAYGLNIRSEIELPEFEQISGPIFDLDIRVHPPTDKDIRNRDIINEGEHVYSWPNLDIGQVVIRNAEIVDLYPSKVNPLSILAVAVHGPIMACILHLRGNLVLHAGAIEIDNAGVILVGDSGSGKSTSSASLLASGRKLICDDVVAIAQLPSFTPTITPAFPQIKLSEEAASHINLTRFAEKPAPIKDFGKKLFDTRKQFRETPIAPKIICVLTTGAELSSYFISGTEALQAIMRSTYLTMRREYKWSQIEKARHFAQCASLLQTVQVVKLVVPRDFKILPSLNQLIESQLHSLNKAEF